MITKTKHITEYEVNNFYWHFVKHHKLKEPTRWQNTRDKYESDSFHITDSQAFAFHNKLSPPHVDAKVAPVQNHAGSPPGRAKGDVQKTDTALPTLHEDGSDRGGNARSHFRRVPTSAGALGENRHTLPSDPSTGQPSRQRTASMDVAHR